MIPIFIRTNNRPFYLNTTLHSLLASDLNNSKIIISDDCSNDKIMQKYLFTNKNVKFNVSSWNNQLKNQITTSGSIIKQNEQLTNNQIWEKYIGNIPFIKSDTGIYNKFTIIQPKLKKGDVGGLFWNIFMAFSLFSNSKFVIILEDDLVFNKDWLNVAIKIYNQYKDKDKIGCISVYNRQFENQNTLYSEKYGIGGVMYLIPRTVFNFMTFDKMFNKLYDKDSIGGDITFLNYLISKDLKILNSNKSYIQHIGIQSLSRPGRFLRYSPCFINPISWN